MCFSKQYHDLSLSILVCFAVSGRCDTKKRPFLDLNFEPTPHVKPVARVKPCLLPPELPIAILFANHKLCWHFNGKLLDFALFQNQVIGNWLSFIYFHAFGRVSFACQ